MKKPLVLLIVAGLLALAAVLFSETGSEGGALLPPVSTERQAPRLAANLMLEMEAVPRDREQQPSVPTTPARAKPAPTDLVTQIRAIETGLVSSSRANMLERALLIRRLVEQQAPDPAAVAAVCDEALAQGELSWGMVFLRAFAAPSEQTDLWTVEVAKGDADPRGRPGDLGKAAGYSAALFGGLTSKRALLRLHYERTPNVDGTFNQGVLPIDLLKNVSPSMVEQWARQIESEIELDEYGKGTLEGLLARLGTNETKLRLIEDATTSSTSPARFANLVEDPALIDAMNNLAHHEEVAPGGPGAATVSAAKKAAYRGLLRIGTEDSVQIVFNAITQRQGRWGRGSPNAGFLERPLPRVVPKLLDHLPALPPGSHADTNVHDYIERSIAQIPGMILAEGEQAGRDLLEELRSHQRPGDERAGPAYDRMIAELEKWL